MKAQILTNMVAPYRNPFFAAIAKKMDLNVCFNVLSEPGRNWDVDLSQLGYDYTILGEKGVSYKRERADLQYTESRSLHLGLGVLAELRKNHPDCIVSLEFGLRSLLAISYGLVKRTPVILWWEGTLHTEKEISFARKILRRFMIGFFAGYWVNGKDSAAYLDHLGAKKNKQLDMTGVDTPYFSQQYNDLLPNRETLRERYDLRGTTYLFSGSLSGRKGIREYLAAIKKFAPSLEKEVTFLFVGDGEYRQEIEELSQISKYVHIVMTGFIQQSELPAYYVSADIFVLPTLDDNWPLATLEASVFGLPQIFSRYNGASADLCASDEDGWVIDPLDVDDFVQALETGYKRGGSRVRKERTAELVTKYAPDTFAMRAVDSFRVVS